MENEIVSYDLPSGGRLSFCDLQEELKMGGPYVGTVMLNNKTLAGKFSIPPIISGSKVCLSKFKKSYWKAFFKILIVDLESKVVLESKASFKLLYLKELKGPDEVLFYEANHDKIEDYKRKLKINNHSCPVDYTYRRKIGDCALRREFFLGFIG